MKKNYQLENILIHLEAIHSELDLIDKAIRGFLSDDYTTKNTHKKVLRKEEDVK